MCSLILFCCMAEYTTWCCTTLFAVARGCIIVFDERLPLSSVSYISHIQASRVGAPPQAFRLRTCYFALGSEL
jgi:hypothetical protein